MRFRRLLIIAFITTIALFASLCVHARAANMDIPSADNVLRLRAGDIYFDEESNRVLLSGNVDVEYGSMTLSVPALTVNTASETFEATAPLRFERDAMTVDGVGMEFNYASGTGSIGKPSGCRNGVHFWGDSVSFSSSTLTLFNAGASTCAPGSLDYHLTARRLTIDPESRLTLERPAFYIKGRRIFGWSRYSVSLGGERGVVKQETTVGGFHLRQPKLSYARYGGVEIYTGVYRAFTDNIEAGLDMDYYIRAGQFTQIHAKKVMRDGTLQLRVGKRFKHNNDYFRYLGPVKVWSYPDLEYVLNERVLRGKLTGMGAMSIGRFKEAHMKSPIFRAATQASFRYKMNSKPRRMDFLLADVRLNQYGRGLSYTVFGQGVGTNFTKSDKLKLGFTFMHFIINGRTPLYSDFINSHNKLLVDAATKVSKKSTLFMYTQYDFGPKHFETTEFGVRRMYECVQIEYGWRTDYHIFSLNVTVLGYENKSKKTERN